MTANVKGLNTLIKIQRREIDEVRKQIVFTEQQKEALEMLAKGLAEELERELELAVEYVVVGNFFGNYSERIRKRQEIIAQEIKTLNRRLLELNNDMAVKFGEMKKLEIARDNRLAAARETARKKEEQMFDEIGITQFARAKDQR